MSGEIKATQDNIDLHFFRVFSRAYRAVAEADQRNIKSYGFHPTEFAVLELLYHKGDHPLQEIGAKILITSGSITYVVDKLQERGLVERQACSDDRRITYARLSEAGKVLMDQLFPVHAVNIAELVKGITREEKVHAIGLLKKLGLTTTAE